MNQVNRIPLSNNRVKQNRSFFGYGNGRTFSAAGSSDEYNIIIYDEIGIWGVTAGEFRSALTDADGRNIVMDINSPGGDVFDGITMYNDLLDYPGHVTARVRGMAASAASFIPMAADRIEIASNAQFMIHNAMAGMMGWFNKEDLLSLAGELAPVDESIAETYIARTGGSIADVQALMTNETWLKGIEAVDAGFVDVVTGAIEVDATFDLSFYANAPQQLSASNEPKTKRDVERLLMHDAKLSRSQARSAMAACSGVMQDADALETTAALTRLLDTIRSNNNV